MRLFRSVFTASGLALLMMLPSCGGGSTPDPPPPTATPDERANYLVGQMTLDEKIHLVHGGAAFDWGGQILPRGAGGWIPGISRLNIPDLYFADGSVGVDNFADGRVGDGAGQATALPSSIASAASWDLAEAAKYGQVIGAEMRASGLNVNLGGNVNLTG